VIRCFEDVSDAESVILKKVPKEGRRRAKVAHFRKVPKQGADGPERPI
jgi:hypothetical protein